jgi:LysR family transcriptional activator of nhaA
VFIAPLTKAYRTRDPDKPAAPTCCLKQANTQRLTRNQRRRDRQHGVIRVRIQHISIFASSRQRAYNNVHMAAIGKTDIAEQLAHTNLNHLLYFWAVGQTGSVTGASKRLGVSQSSVSEQVRILETRLKAKLLERTSRGVVLTPSGEIVMRYVQQVVVLCSDMFRALPDAGRVEIPPLVVGCADYVPKVVVRALLQPIFGQSIKSRVICREWRFEQMLMDLTMHRLDLLVADASQEQSGSGIRWFDAGSSPLSFYAVPELARKYRATFPQSLAEAPLLVPAEGAALRATLDRWFAARGVTPNVIVEAEDRALLHHFAEIGMGLTPVASVTAAEVSRQFNLVKVGELKQVSERYYIAIAPGRDEHPLVASLLERLSSGKALLRVPATRSAVAHD